ncbi:hypothetical protein V5J35_003217 [Endozoicomonas sp. NE40]|uniref:DUF4019 domain-containing protein n=1 Tax=Endozoicomonas lisbonensis TaxID=3120522 RepID=A0ABV2SJU5_9GAMM
MIYKTKFTNKDSAIETVTFIQVGDEWKAVGYFIK